MFTRPHSRGLSPPTRATNGPGSDGSPRRAKIERLLRSQEEKVQDVLGLFERRHEIGGLRQRPLPIADGEEVVDQRRAVRMNPRLEAVTARELKTPGEDFIDGAGPSGGEQFTHVVELDLSPLDSEPLRARGRQGAFVVLETAEVAEVEARNAAPAERLGRLGQRQELQTSMARVAASMADCESPVSVSSRNPA